MSTSWPSWRRCNHYALFGAGHAGTAPSSRIQEQRRRDLSTPSRAFAPTYESLVGSDKIGLLLSQYHTLDDTKRSVAEIAVGHGSDGTGAFDLLQGPVATADAAFLDNVTQVVDNVVKDTNQNLNSVVAINRMEAIHLWLFILLGGLFGAAMAEATVRRIVRSISLVIDRTQAIAEGDLTGEVLYRDSNDEITSLADSINRMQDNLREMIRTMMEISTLVSEDSQKLSRSAGETFRRTKEQSLQTQQAAAAMQEMSISISEVSRMRRMPPQPRNRLRVRLAKAAQSSSKCSPTCSRSRSRCAIPQRLFSA